MKAGKWEHGAFLSELQKNPKLMAPPKVIIPRFAWQGALTCLWGREKIGKTTLLNHGITAATKGELFLGRKCQQGMVVYCGFEEMKQTGVQRLTKLGADGDQIYMVDMLQGDWASALGRIVEDVKPVLVVVDTLSKLLGRAKIRDQNDAGGIDAVFLPPLYDLVRHSKQKPGILFNGHANKSEGEARGSTSLTAAMDVNLTIKAPNGNRKPQRSIVYEGRWGHGKFDIEFVTGPGGKEYFQLDQNKLPLPDQILRYVSNNPGCSQASVRSAVHGGANSKIADMLKTLVNDGVLVNRGTQNQGKYYLSTNSNGTATSPDETPLTTRAGQVAGTDSVLNPEPLESASGTDEVAL